MTQTRAVAEASGDDGTGNAIPGDGRRNRFITAIGHPGVIAVLTWLVATPLAAMIPGLLNINPFTQRGADVPLALGGLAVVAVAAAALWRRGPGVQAIPGVPPRLFAPPLLLIL